MENLPDEVFSATSVREIDRRAIASGIAGYTLMNRAAEAALNAALQQFPNAKRWQIICGPGNNGGDGFVLARLAMANSINVSVVSMSQPNTFGGDLAIAYRDFINAGGIVNPWSGELDPEADLIIDSVLGSGQTRNLGGALAAAADAINGHRAPVLALDIPTGLHPDSGKTLGRVVEADLTVTFAGLKTGLFLGEGPACTGELRFAGIGIPSSTYCSTAPAMRRLSDQQRATLLPNRKKTANKGDFGHVLVIGGGAGMPGAVQLCGLAALRAGAGRVTVATAPEHAAMISMARPELMSHAIRAAEDLDGLLSAADVIAFGPGLGQSDWAKMIYDRVAGEKHLCVWDADALNLLADREVIAEQRVITPHPGEASRLLSGTAKDIQSDRANALASLQRKFGGVVVLKGAGSLISSKEGVPWVCSAGNPGMAAPGMGDVLTGVIAAFMAQGLSPQQAACAGVQAHAAAGDRAAVGGQRGMMATDLLPELRMVVNP